MATTSKYEAATTLARTTARALNEDTIIRHTTSTPRHDGSVQVTGPNHEAIANALRQLGFEAVVLGGYVLVTVAPCPTCRKPANGHRHDLPNLYGKDGQLRPDTERKLNAAVTMGAIFSASIQPNGRYRLVNQGGSEFANLTTAQANMAASFAMTGFREGRATA